MSEVYDRYVDTAGNFHYSDVETGHHVIPKQTFTPYQSLFYGCGINYPRCKEDCYWYNEEPDMGAYIPCCQSKGGNYIEPKDCENCEHYHSKYKKTNADRIRSMTDEELASVITDDWCEIVCSGTDYLCDGTCKQHVLKWLKEEVKDDTRIQT